jgi:hypothetical protein
MLGTYKLILTCSISSDRESIKISEFFEMFCASKRVLTSSREFTSKHWMALNLKNIRVRNAIY